MGQVKVCPILQAAKGVAEGAAAGRARVSGSTACRGVSCAWYDAGLECCALLSLSRRV